MKTAPLLTTLFRLGVETTVQAIVRGHALWYQYRGGTSQCLLYGHIPLSRLSRISETSDSHLLSKPTKTSRLRNLTFSIDAAILFSDRCKKICRKTRKMNT